MAAHAHESSTGPAIELRELTLRFDTKTVLDRISLEVAQGEVFFVMGPSGCGKTTLVKCVTRLLEPTEGAVCVEGRDLAALSEEELASLRRRMGMVFQGGALLNSLSLAANVALPMQALLHMPQDLVDEAVRMKLAQVGLLDAADKMPAELSGGMRKRAGIARALALDPTLLFLDEPTSGLDPVTADGIDALMLELRRSLDATVVVISHDLPSAAKCADRLVVLMDGRAVALGTPDEVRAMEDRDVQDFLDRRSRPVKKSGAAVLGGRDAHDTHPTEGAS